MSVDKNAIREVLEFDSVAEAEKIGKQSRRDRNVNPLGLEQEQMLGLLFHMGNSDRKRQLLKQSQDTYMGSTLDEYFQIITSLGFQKVQELEYNSFQEWDADNPAAWRKEKHYICWEPKRGILLAFDTYHGGVNGGSFYYNWKANEKYWDTLRSDNPNPAYGVTSSGRGSSVEKGVYIGYHDCREALKYHIERLEEWGAFVNPWVECDTPWVLHHMDTKDARGRENYNYEDTTRMLHQRLSQLPDWLKKAIAYDGPRN